MHLKELAKFKFCLNHLQQLYTLYFHKNVNSENDQYIYQPKSQKEAEGFLSTFYAANIYQLLQFNPLPPNSQQKYN